MTAVIERRPTAGTRRRPVTRPQVRAGSAEEYLGVVGAVFTVVAITSLWVVLQLSVLSAYGEHRAQHLMYPQFRTSLAEATAPTGGRIQPGTPVAILTVPEIGLRQVVVEGTSGAELRGGPGHRRDTALPGQQGVSVVAGRAHAYGGPFAHVPGLAVGQRLIVDMAQGRVVYHVTGVRRGGTRVPQPPAAGAGQLTLVTAEGSGALASLRPSSVVYVDAKAAKAFPAGTHLDTVPASEQAMATDRSALPLLALSLAVLLGVAYVAVAEWNRRHKPLVWVVTAPVLLAIGWFTTDVVVRLLPNLI